MRLVLILVAAVAASPAVAHHSISAAYDTAKQVEIEGVVSRLDVQNPHSILVVRSSAAEVWELESRGAAGMQRSGFDSSVVAVGDRVTVKANPARDGGNRLWMVGLTTAKGRAFDFSRRPTP